MNKSDTERNARLLSGRLSRHGYMRWWHSFCATNQDTGEVRTFFIEYYIVNPALGGSQVVLGQYPQNKKLGIKPTYAMIKAGAFPTEKGNDGVVLSTYYPIDEFKSTEMPFHFEMGDCEYNENRISGSIEVSRLESTKPYLMTDCGCMEWDLEISKSIACHTGFVSGLFGTLLGALDSFWHGEGIKTYFRGNVYLNGEQYKVTPDDCFGYADKHWGKSFNEPWMQLACCHLISERTGNILRHSALAIDGCCPRFFFIPLRRKMIIQLTYTGEDFEYNFSNPFKFTRYKWKLKETNKRELWHILAQNRDSLIKISGYTFKDTLMPLGYEDPEGKGFRNTLKASANAVGTVELYRITPAGKVLIDRLTMVNALWEHKNV